MALTFVTLNTITTDLLNIIRRSNISSSETISKRQLEAWVHEYRALLLKQDLDKGKKPNPDYIQEISHLKLSPIDLVGDATSNTNLLSGEYIYRTILEIPKTIDLNFKSGYMYIGSPTGTEIQLVSEGRNIWQQYKKYTDTQPVCFLKNNRLFIRNNEPLEYITIRGIFEVPSEVDRFINPYTDQPYFNEDTKYPIPINLIPVLKEMILSKELQIEATAPTDTTNDSRSNPQ